MSDIAKDLFTGLVEEDEDVVVAEAPTPEKKLTYEDFPFDDLCTYAGIDCIATSGVALALNPLLTQTETMKIPGFGGKPKEVVAPAIIDSVVDIEMPAHEFVLDMEINGIGYSPARNAFYNKKMAEKVEAFDEKIFTAIGRKLDLESGPAVAEFLYVTKGFDVPYLTKGGEPATDGAALMTLAGLDPTGGKYVTKDPSLQWLADIAKRKDISSVRNTFIKTYVKDWVKRTGRIHPSYNLFGTSSFRITGSDPNLTQLPRAKHGYNVRTCYTVEPGHVFISFDFSSAEVAVLANICKDPRMLRALQDGLDFHAFSASSALGIPYADMKAVLDDQSHPLYKTYKGQRQTFKILTFSID